MALWEFWLAIDERYNTEPDWRWGQTVFNVLYEVRPELADEILATDLDPFFNDARLVALIPWLTERWEA